MPVVLAVTLAGCLNFAEPLRQSISVNNRTTQRLSFEVLVDGEALALFGPIGPGETSPIIAFTGVVPNKRLLGNDGCTLRDVIAYDDEEREVARHPPGLCIGETWVIE